MSVATTTNNRIIEHGAYPWNLNQESQALKQMLAISILNGQISGAEANAVLSLLGMDKEKEASQGQVDAQNAVDMVGRLSSSLSGRQLTGPLKGLMGLNPYATEQQDMQILS